MISKRKMLLVAALCLLAATDRGYAQAQAWPTRPVKFIAPFAAGGTSDTLGRIAAEHLREKLHQQFFVENRVGAGGLIGSHEVALAEPDGYTFVISGIASHVIAPGKLADIIVLKKDPIADITILQGGRHLSYVIKDGKIVDLGAPEDLLAFQQAAE